MRSFWVRVCLKYNMTGVFTRGGCRETETHREERHVTTQAEIDTAASQRMLRTTGNHHKLEEGMEQILF